MEIKYDPFSRRSVVERMLYVLSLILISISLNATLMSFEGCIFLTALIIYKGTTAIPIDLIYCLFGIIAGSIGLILSLGFRTLGIRKFKFLVHEAEFNSIIEDIEDREDFRKELIAFKEKIEELEGYERQQARQEAKKYLEDNEGLFDDVEQNFIDEHFYYLITRKESNE